jgi:1-deoxy-D-xylulose-5-phosphate synthase
VVFALDRAGLVAATVPRTRASYDYSFLRCIPNLTVMAPADENECRQMLYTATTLAGRPRCVIRAARGPRVELQAEMSALPLGKAQVRRTASPGC